jgi:hypothetical protein
LAHEDPAMLERARVAFNEGRLCEEFVPVPKSLHIVAGCVSDEAEQKKLEEDTAKNLEIHGYGNWYDYCVNEWGTKWDVGGDGMTAEMENGQLVMAFDSAWSPPVAFYEKMLDLGFEVRAYYYEGGMNFAGIWDNGDDDFYDLESGSAVREQIPAVLDEMFCISEGMEMWEDEENIDIDLDGGLSSTNE